jgi:hypothetical protein
MSLGESRLSSKNPCISESQAVKRPTASKRVRPTKDCWAEVLKKAAVYTSHQNISRLCNNYELRSV